MFGNELWLWSWVTELLVGAPNTGSPRRYIELSELTGGPGFLLRLSIWTALADARPPLSIDRETRQAERVRLQGPEPNAREVISNRTSILAYLSFPLLEGLTKLRCRTYIELDGYAKKSFDVNGEHYGPAKGQRKRISSLGDLLWLLRNRIAETDERQALEAVSAEIRKATGTDGFEQIYGWRNSQAHGSQSLHAIGYTVYNLALLVGLYGIRERYDEIRGDAAEFFAEVARLVQSGTEYYSPWHYYPPHWRPIMPGLAHFSAG